jgi:PRTRC genetic system protein C
MTITVMPRLFSYCGLQLPDLNPKLSVEEIQAAYAASYPEIVTATVTGPEPIGGRLVYTFSKAIGTKG